MALLSRYDLDTLRVEPALPLPTSAPRLEAVEALRAWCRQGLDLDRPQSQGPRVPLALGLVADTPRLGPALEALCRALDGDDQLRALQGAAARWRLKLRVKAQDLAGWRHRRADDIWDSGYLADTPSVLHALQAFQPRRPTLMVADPMSLAALQARWQALQARAAGFGHPVRLLAVVPAEGVALWRAQWPEASWLAG